MSGGQHPLIQLQAADTLIEQLRHRIDHLPERSGVDAARRARSESEGARNALQHRLDELQAVIDDADRRSVELVAKRDRLSAQLRTVIAPREAEALQAEIRTVESERSDLDDAALEALEEQATLADRLDESSQHEVALLDQQREAEVALERALELVEAERAAIVERLDGLRAAVAPSLLVRYDRIRQHQVVAAAELQGSRCTGCHLDLSAAESGEARTMAADDPDGLTDCPHCGRMLVV